MRLFNRVLIVGLAFLLLFGNSGLVEKHAQGFKDRLLGFEQSWTLPYSPAATSTRYEPALSAQAETVASKASSGVVSIFGFRKVSEEMEGGDESGILGMFRRYMSQDLYTEVSAGTGFFVGSQGHILTNNHVVSEPDTKYVVMLPDGSEKTARVVYQDSKNDIAIIDIPGKDYPSLDLGDSSELKIGDTVVGMGNPYGGARNAVTRGSISALRRTIVASGEDEQQKLSNVIQTSAQLYPGDSGGPLLNKDGKVVGINAAIATEWNRVSFSVPINEAKGAVKAVAESQN